MDLNQHLRYERQSLSRYARNSDGTIEWGSVADSVVLDSTDLHSIELGAAFRRFAPNADSLIFFWGSLAIPSVKIGLEASLSCLPGIVESCSEFWVYFPAVRVVVECSFFGMVTAGHVPTDDRGSS
ncbi:hypothetical protein [Streptomyces sp. MP131-18]|uniref:hypothetical protein n=1 Tax=Streptomyces sp. MP131-18 TaxID=1857892 RepID=UPI00117D78A3|nr:hypothetical protein [Streptomyces sp. MP131-18]